MMNKKLTHKQLLEVLEIKPSKMKQLEREWEILSQVTETELSEQELLEELELTPSKVKKLNEQWENLINESNNKS